MSFPGLKQEWNKVLAEYPIFDEGYREHLNTVITEQFINREIGEETPDLFLLTIRRRLRRRMPLYNEMYKARFLEIDPLVTFKTSTDATSSSASQSENDTSSESTSVNESKTRGVASNNPHMILAAKGDYANSIADSVGDASGTSEASAKVLDKSEGESTSSSDGQGYSGLPSDLIAAHISNVMLMNVDDMVIDDLSICFMQIYGNNTPFSNARYY